MNDRPDVLSRLEQLGRRQPSTLTEDRLASIELRVMTATLQQTDPSRSWSRRAMPIVVSAAAALVLFVVVFAATDRSNGDVTVSSADGVVLEFPDGSTVDAQSGDAVPEGVVIRVTGEVVVGSDRFGPGRYRVVAGDLEPIVSVDSSTSTSTVAVTVPTDTSSTPIRTTTTTTNVTTTTRPPTTTTAPTRIVRQPVRTTTTMPTSTMPTSTMPTTSVVDATVPTRPTTTTTVQARPTTTTSTTPTTTRRAGP
jgi:hypothetical protein